ncbi:MAG: hypothetical protein OXF20_02860 [Gammaproteobacteria bacterium]|nr:hypothetical protein [Gammaproteobacteria bacterium]
MLFGIFEQFQCPALQGEANCGKQPDILVGYALEIAGGTTVDLGPLQGLQLYARPWACPDTNPLAATHIVLNGHAVKTLEGSA